MEQIETQEEELEEQNRSIVQLVKGRYYSESILSVQYSWTFLTTFCSIKMSKTVFWLCGRTFCLPDTHYFDLRHDRTDCMHGQSVGLQDNTTGSMSSCSDSQYFCRGNLLVVRNNNTLQIQDTNMRGGYIEAII